MPNFFKRYLLIKISIDSSYDVHSARARVRTWDLPSISRLLYQLSYTRTLDTITSNIHHSVGLDLFCDKTGLLIVKKIIIALF